VTMSSLTVSQNLLANRLTATYVSASTVTFSSSTNTNLTVTGVITVSTVTAIMPITISSLTVTKLASPFAYHRRPVLQYGSSTIVNIETGISGLSGRVPIIFPDGSYFVEATTANIQCDLSKKANWGNGTMQGGLRPAETLSNNRWYAIYVVKSSATGNSSDFVAVASTALPIQANFNALNANFGSAGWVYLGMVRYGDNGSNPNQLLRFMQTGSTTRFRNSGIGGNSGARPHGVLLATTASAASLTYTYSSGTGSADIPVHLTNVYFQVARGPASAGLTVGDSGDTFDYIQMPSVSNRYSLMFLADAAGGIKSQTTGGVAAAHDITIVGWIDGVLGVGSNPQF
jgi:hypothetical protein